MNSRIRYKEKDENHNNSINFTVTEVVYADGVGCYADVQ